MNAGMSYCERCYTLNKQNVCQNCGNKKPRKPNNNDYCFLTEVDTIFGEILAGIFEEENIPCVKAPSGTGVRTAFALKLENLKMFVPYEFYDKAFDVLNDILITGEQEQRKNFLNGIANLFILPRTEKKVRKTLKLSEKSNVLEYCKDEIIKADKFENQGNITGCFKGGNYIFIYTKNEVFIVNSATYEIISAKNIKR